MDKSFSACLLVETRAYSATAMAFLFVCVRCHRKLNHQLGPQQTNQRQLRLGGGPLVKSVEVLQIDRVGSCIPHPWSTSFLCRIGLPSPHLSLCCSRNIRSNSVSKPLRPNSSSTSLRN